MYANVIRREECQSLAKWAGLKIRFRRNPRVQIPSLAYFFLIFFADLLSFVEDISLIISVRQNGSY